MQHASSNQARIAILLVTSAVATASASEPLPLPRFTEEREAAALHFVKKHVPEIAPFLEHLKKNQPQQYQSQIREIFQITEFLADLQDEPRRHDLELKIWITENKAHAFIARLSHPNEAERKKAEASLMELAKELVELSVQVMELKADQLDKELGEIKDELARMRDQVDKEIRARYEALVSQVRKRKP